MAWCPSAPGSVTSGLAKPTQASRGVGHSLLDLAASRSAREVMRSTTAVRPKSASKRGPRNRRTCWSDGLCRSQRATDTPTSSLIGDAAKPTETRKTTDQRFRWSEAVSVGLAGLELAASSSGEDPRPRWQTTWYLPRSTRTSPPPRSSERPRGRVLLPIFIRHGWPTAMNHLSAIEGSPLCGAAFPQVAADRQGRSNAF
jgi:hypothetical protein